MARRTGANEEEQSEQDFLARGGPGLETRPAGPVQVAPAAPPPVAPPPGVAPATTAPGPGPGVAPAPGGAGAGGVGSGGNPLTPERLVQLLREKGIQDFTIISNPIQTSEGPFYRVQLAADEWQFGDRNSRREIWVGAGLGGAAIDIPEQWHINSLELRTHYGSGGEITLLQIEQHNARIAPYLNEQGELARWPANPHHPGVVAPMKYVDHIMPISPDRAEGVTIMPDGSLQTVSPLSPQQPATEQSAVTYLTGAKLRELTSGTEFDVEFIETVSNESDIFAAMSRAFQGRAPGMRVLAIPVSEGASIVRSPCGANV